MDGPQILLRQGVPVDVNALRRKALSLAKRIGALGLGARRAQPLNREYVTVTNRAERIALAYGITGCRGFSAV